MAKSKLDEGWKDVIEGTWGKYSSSANMAGTNGDNSETHHFDRVAAKATPNNPNNPINRKPNLHFDPALFRDRFEYVAKVIKSVSEIPASGPDVEVRNRIIDVAVAMEAQAATAFISKQIDKVLSNYERKGGVFPTSYPEEVDLASTYVADNAHTMKPLGDHDETNNITYTVLRPKHGSKERVYNAPTPFTAIDKSRREFLNKTLKRWNELKGLTGPDLAEKLDTLINDMHINASVIQDTLKRSELAKSKNKAVASNSTQKAKTGDIVEGVESIGSWRDPVAQSIREDVYKKMPEKEVAAEVKKIVKGKTAKATKKETSKKRKLRGK